MRAITLITWYYGSQLDWQNLHGVNQKLDYMYNKCNTLICILAIKNVASTFLSPRWTSHYSNSPILSLPSIWSHLSLPVVIHVFVSGSLTYMLHLWFKFPSPSRQRSNSPLPGHSRDVQMSQVCWGVVKALKWSMHKAQFKCWSFHIPNLIPLLSTWKDWQLDRLSLTYLIWVDPWIKIEWPTWEFRLWSDLVSNIEHLICQTNAKF